MGKGAKEHRANVSTGKRVARVAVYDKAQCADVDDTVVLSRYCVCHVAVIVHTAVQFVLCVCRVG